MAPMGVRLAMAAAIVAACLVTTATSTALRNQGDMAQDKSTKFTIKDSIAIDGSVIATGAAISDVLGCNEFPAGTSSIKVCGCGVKVVANLLTECQEYTRYQEQVGKCDCGTTECDDVSLESGYTNKFNWKAHSFSVEAC